MGSRPGRTVTPGRRRYSLTFLIVFAILFGEALPIGVADYLTNRANHQWCDLFAAVNSGPPASTAHGRLVVRVFEQRARSLGCR